MWDRSIQLIVIAILTIVLKIVEFLEDLLSSAGELLVYVPKSDIKHTRQLTRQQQFHPRASQPPPT